MFFIPLASCTRNRSPAGEVEACGCFPDLVLSSKVNEWPSIPQTLPSQRYLRASALKAGSHPCPLLGDKQSARIPLLSFQPVAQPGFQSVLPSHGGSGPPWSARLRDSPPRHRLPHRQAGAGAPQPEPSRERVSGRGTGLGRPVSWRRLLFVFLSYWRLEGDPADSLSQILSPGNCPH